MLSEGYPYAEIIHDLENKPGFRYFITKQNLSNWKKGGYQDWLEDQQWIIETRLNQDFALDLLKNNEATAIHEATLHVAVTQIAQALRRFDPDCLNEALREQPANYLRLLDVLAKLSYTGLNCEHRRQEKVLSKEIWNQTLSQYVERQKLDLKSKAAELKKLKSKPKIQNPKSPSLHHSTTPCSTNPPIPPEPEPVAPEPPVSAEVEPAAPQSNEAGLVAPESNGGRTSG
jgi:hypothetical protein